MNTKGVDSTAAVSYLGNRKFGASAGASSSTTTNSEVAEGQYEVFLSFHGKDTRKSFTDFLYTYLVDASVRTFRDDNELNVGEEIGPELLKAIKESKILIPIFSKNYASSKWCLLELEEMVKCHMNGKQKIYPIFYDVTPDNVQDQTGSYEIAFSENAIKFDQDTLQRWRRALGIAGRLKGLELKKTTNGYEGQLVKIIVEEVLWEMKKNYTHVPQNLVGIEHHIKEVEGLLKVDSNDVRVVGIYGMGGLGKTTIAKTIYNKLGRHFNGLCFLDNVRENSKCPKEIVDLQMQLISAIQKKKGVSSFTDVNEGKSKIKDVVYGKKVLLILDDIDDYYEVHMLMGDQSWFSAGSRIIITTRDKNILDEIKSRSQKEEPCAICKAYEPHLMEDHHALLLFCKYAFMRDTPLEGYEIFSEEVVSIAKGLPLVLVVLGSDFIRVKGKDSWEQKLMKLRVIPSGKVMDKLKFSFDGLEYEEKQIFLDIACFFIGTDIRMATYMWDDCGFFPILGLEVLVRKSLIKYGADYKVTMHDHLRDLGLQIIREENLNEPGKRSRLLPKEALKMLETCQVRDSVQAIDIKSDVYGNEVALEQHLPNLRFLRIRGHFVEELLAVINFDPLLSNLRFNRGYFPNLRWLECWVIMFGDINFKNLVVVLVRSCYIITDDWEGWNELKMSTKLKLLHLSSCPNIRVLPNFSASASLEMLILSNCWNLTRLDGLQQLKSLKHLDAYFCRGLNRLPNLSNLTKLVVLNLMYCIQLAEISGLEKLQLLQVLNLKECASLRYLNLSGCYSLEDVDLSYCSKLTTLDGLQHLKSLKHMNASFCSALERLPNLSNLTKLVVLHLKECVSLRYLNLSGCYSLEDVHLSNCSNLTRLDGLQHLKSLKHLDASFCETLAEIQGLQKLELLQVLKLGGCVSLRYLNLSRCYSLENVDLSYLKLDFFNVPYFSNPKMSESVESFFNLEEIPWLHRLEEVYLFQCDFITILPNLSYLKRLIKIEVVECSLLTEIKCLEGLDFLEHLRVSWCLSLERLPNLSNLRKLEEFDCIGCDKIIEIQGIDNLQSLKVLKVTSCHRRLPDLPNFGMLKEMEVRGCDRLEDVHRIGVVESLESLSILYCDGLWQLPNLQNLKKLKILIIHSLDNLAVIYGLEELKSLEHLELTDCENLFGIHGLEELKSLKLLDIRDSKGIKNLPYLPSVTIRSGPRWN